MKTPLSILIAGGGTGGHVFPGIAAAQALAETDPRIRVLFAGTGRPQESQWVARAGFPHVRIIAEGIKGMGWTRRLISFVKIPAGILQSALILRGFRPDLVIGVGGYASGPMMLAARLLGIPTLLQEQNRLPGITNRLLSHIADRICVSFPPSPGDGFSERAKRKGRLRFTGNPIRSDLVKAGAVRTGKTEDEALSVLILGGSQGARPLNRAVTEALPHLRTMTGLKIIHQTGPADFEWVRKAYDENAVPGDVRPFFHNMAACYGRASMIICRAGATTVAEITALGLPAVFVPFPHAADDHQTHNARSLEEAGAAEMIPQRELTGERLARRIESLMAAPERLLRMSRASKRFGRPDAARHVASVCRSLIRNPNIRTGEEITC